MFAFVQKFADWLVYEALNIGKETKLGDALNFFVYDTIKIFILLFIIMYVITFIRTFFPPEKTRKYLAKHKGVSVFGNVLAALLGIVTPFCSCSAVPLFIGFVEAGIPLGVTFSYIIAAPIVDTVALGMLYGIFGWKIALIYMLSGAVIAFIGGIILGSLKLEKYVEDYVFRVQAVDVEIQEPTLNERLKESLIYTIDLLKKIWVFVVIGIGIGALMHGWIPTGAFVKFAGKDSPFTVFIAVAGGVPLYSNAVGMIPIVSELTRAGVSMGTALAFMMSVVALSVPEMILLRRVLKPKLLVIFITIVASGIIFIGYLFNFIL